MYAEQEIDLGRITMGKLEEWAKEIPRFVELTNDDSWLQKTYERAIQELKDRRCPEEMIAKFITKAFFTKAICSNLTVIFTRDAIQGYFSHKSEAAIVNETLSNEEWLEEATEQGVGWLVNCAVLAFNELCVRKAIASVIQKGASEYESGESNEGDCEE